MVDGDSGAGWPEALAAESIRVRAAALARDGMHYSGREALAFVEQFTLLASRPLAVWLDGDGEHFRQAVCFPGLRVGDADQLLPFANLPPCLLLERPDGLLAAMQICDVGHGRYSLAALLRSLGRSLEGLADGPGAWQRLQKGIELLARRRVKLLDFPLDDEVAAHWRTFFAGADAELENSMFRGLQPVSGLARKGATAVLVEMQSAWLGVALRQFCGGLSGEIFAALRATGLPVRVSGYNSYRLARPQVARYRLQVAETVPLMGSLLSAEDYRTARLRRLVDAGQPLWPALADLLGVPEETVRWLRGKELEDVGTVWRGRVPQLAASLAQLPPERRPRNREEWTVFTDFALMLDQPEEQRRHGRWLKELGRIGWAGVRQKFASLGAVPWDLHDIGDLLDELKVAIGCELLPQIAALPPLRRLEYSAWQMMSDFIEEAFFEQGVIRQLRASLRWHRLQLQAPGNWLADVEEPEEASARIDAWPVPVDGPVDIGVLSAHFLNTTAQLIAEGRRMLHCVGSYSSKCLFAGSNIVSMRTRDGRSVSTAELRLVPGAHRFGFEVVQHRAPGNEAPPTAAEKALQQLLAMITGDAMQTRLQAMQLALIERQRHEHWRQRLLGESPLAPQRLQALKLALQLHIGYERFLRAGRKALAIETALRKRKCDRGEIDRGRTSVENA